MHELPGLYIYKEYLKDTIAQRGIYMKIPDRSLVGSYQRSGKWVPWLY